MASYIHPSISSTITDNSTTFITASGTTKLFAAFTSEKGVDNKIQMITSVSEYEFYYGKPNIKLYGQVGYNIVNWLNSGGVVYCLRVLPEDAGYANAIVNIQTKVGEKQVFDADGDTVVVDQVTLRPTVSYTSVNNISESAIEFDELRKGITDTYDGYKNHMLFAVIPRGRGKGYNDLGFRITLNDNYDTTYDFRLYNFEVTQVSDSGSTSTIEGPFIVSLDPDALSNSGESMFIENVINKYSNYYTIIFNEKNYELLGEIINPNVNPNKLDFFNGITRDLDGTTETYYDEKTGKDEDIHLSLIKYINGVSTGERDIVDPTDSIESSIVNIDNTYRTKVYNRYNEKFETMKKALSRFRVSSEAYKEELNNLSSEKDAAAYNGSYKELTDAIADLSEQVELAKDDPEKSVDSKYYEAVSEKMKDTEDTLNTLIDKLYAIYDTASIYPTDADALKAQVDLESVEQSITLNNKYSIKFTSMLEDSNDLRDKFDDLILNGNTVEKIEYLAELIESLSDIKNILNATDVNSDAEVKVDYDATEDMSDVVDHDAESAKQLVSNMYAFADKHIQNVGFIISDLLSKYDILSNEFTTSEEIKEILSEIFKAEFSTKLFESLKNAINYTLLEYQSYNIISSHDLVATVVSSFNSYQKSIIDSITNGTDTLKVDDILNELETFKLQVYTKKQDTYRTVLQNFDRNIQLLYGSDGSIDGLLPSSTEVEKLIIRGYKGTIDESLTNKDLYPIDLVLDANYSTTVKNALITLTTSIRDDFIAILDTKFQATPEQTLTYRKSSLPVSNFRVSIFSQDFVVIDGDYTGQRMQVTPTYFLASKIPTNDDNNGIHWNFVGPRRGTISGFESISYVPNPEWKEQLYKSQINYIEQDTDSTRFNSQLTSQSVVSALSNINNVRTLLRIQRDVESLMKDYIFEWNDGTTRSEAQLALNAYLSKWTSNRACDSISGSVYASDYDRLEKLMRVKIEIVFNSVIERIAIDLVVNS